MTRTRRPMKLLLVLVATTLVGVAATAAAPLVAAGKSGLDRFGYTAVRSGIPAGARPFKVSSTDLQDNHAFSNSEIADVFGCTGGNHAPVLAWSGAPAGTQSFAVTMFDPDAPTGSGFWHWLIWDIPATAEGLDASNPPSGTTSGTNDAGMVGYMGPCPPKGDRTHRYQITVYALDVASLDGVSQDSHAAVVAFTMRTHILGFARLVGTYSQPA